MDLDSAPQELRTERLLLRRWREEDRVPFAALNADPIVMKHFVAPLDRATSDQLVDRIDACFERNHYGLWAVEPLETGEFCGYVGLWSATFEAPFNPSLEIGWRLDSSVWGRGFAPEAALAALADGFERLDVDEIVSFTATTNLASMRVMTKIGMRTDPAENFDHPNVPVGHRVERHVLYRIARPVDRS